MKKFVMFTLATLLLVGVFTFSGCRPTQRRTTWFSGDKNVTIVKHKKYKRYKPNTKPVTSRRFNRAPSRYH
ncbi:MAG: hypothetical protein H6581_30840 [Bacteroidia bacterium]|nr:hypothetical protein [Bacteroidia bacterium]